MKKEHLLFFAIVFMLVSCNTAPHIQTNEERAENLVSNCIKDWLTYPESYEPIYTKIDSSRINLSNMGKIIELTEDCTDLYDKIRNLEWRKEEYELEFKLLNSKLEEKIKALRTTTDNLYDKEINGWGVTHRFRCQNDYGAQMPPQEMLFFCDLNFETCQGWTAEQIESFFTIIECVEESETDKLLLNNLKDIRYIFNYF